MRILFLTLLIYFSEIAFSRELNFEYLTSDDGLSHSSVTCIIQDNEGFMWIGTKYGLNRYDGYSFVNYYHDTKDASTIAGDQIEDLIVDHEGNLWIATNNGLSRYDRNRCTFINYIQNDSLPNSLHGLWVSCLFEDSKGRIWIGTIGGGINLYNKEKNNFTSFVHNPNDPVSLSEDNIRGIAEDKDHNLWFGTERTGINRFHEDKKSFTNYLHFTAHRKSLSNNSIYDIATDENGNVWIGTLGGGISQIEKANDGEIIFRNYRPETSDIRRLKILSITAALDGGLWIGTENGGLDYFNIRNKSFRNYQIDEMKPNTLNNNSIHAIYEDPTGNLWIGTYTGGVNIQKNNKKKIITYRKIPGNKNSLSYNAVSSFFEDESGKIWIGTDGGGINLWDRSTDKMTQFNSQNTSLQSDAILAICADRDRNICVGGWEVAFNKYIGNNTFTTYTQKDGIPNNNIFDMVLDHKGSLWAAFGGIGFGKYNYDTKTFKVYSTENINLPSPWISDISVDYSDNILLAHSSGFSIFYPKEDKLVNYTNNISDTNSLSQNQVNTILVSDDSTIWIGTINGLNHFFPKEQKFIRYSEQQGLPYNNIAGLVEDNRGNIWISTGDGISVFIVKKHTFKNYRLSDGLQGKSFIRNSAYKTTTGEILFGGTNGFNIFHPDSLKDNKYIPPIVITGFFIFNKPVTVNDFNSPLTSDISQTKKLTLSYKQTVFSFEFVALDYTSTEENKYAYYLEGFEKDWNYVGTKRLATYTNLDAGNYIFHVKGSNNDGVWNEQGVTIAIKVTPPYWETWWFRFGAGLMAFFIVFAYFMLRMRSIKSNNILLEGLVDKRTRELSIKNDLLNKQKDELNEINTILEERQQQIEEQAEELLTQKEELVYINDELSEVNATKDKFFSIIAHDIKNPFGTIMGFVELMQLNFQKWNEEKKLYYLNIIADTTKNVYSLLDNLLQWSRSQRGVMEFHPKKIQAGTMVNSVIDLFKNAANVKEINLLTQISENDCMITVDERMLDTILRNLVSNAIKFTPRKGTITVSYSKVGEKIVFKVQDTGMGMNESQLSGLFQIDSHQSSEGTEHEKGTGIGLILTKDFIQRHSGKIWAESKPGKGTTFSFELPIDILS